MQTSVNGAANQNLAQSSSSIFNGACQTPHAKTRNGIARQFFAFRIVELLNTYLCCAKRIEAQNLARRCIVHQNEDGADAFCILLCSVLVQVVIQRRHLAMKPCPIVQPGIKNLLLKHA